MPVEVFGADEQQDHPIDLERFVALASAALEAEGVRGPAEVSLLFVDEDTIAGLNERFMHKSGPTDVLSFPIEDEDPSSGRFPDAGTTGPTMGDEEPEAPTLLGDVVICPKVAERNAVAHGASFDDETALLVVHGVLHLLGWDHQVEAEAERMEARERHLLGAHWSSGVR
jgi:probable rRNA maturation factor